MRKNDLRHNPYEETKQRERLVDKYVEYIMTALVILLLSTVVGLLVVRGGWL